MKKVIVLLLYLLPVFLLCGCSLDFSEQAEEGSFSYAYGKKAAFITEYRWDGTEEGKTVVIPERINGLKVVSVGGFFGRGLPMPFYVDISDYFADDVQWKYPAEINSADETVELAFTLILPEQIGYDDVTVTDWEWSEWAAAENGKTVEYQISIDIGYGE